MIRGMRSTLILSAILLALGAYIYFVESERPTSEEAASAKAKAFAFESERINRLRITASDGDVTTLEKRDGTWQLLEPAGAQAAEMEVSGVASALASLEIERVVEEEATDLSVFGLAEPAVDVEFELTGEETPRHLRLGDETATGGDRYARIDDEPRVFLIAGYLENTFDRSSFDLRDKSILDFERDQVDHLELTRREGAVVASKTDGQWMLEAPWSVRADSSTLESLLTRLQTVQMKSIVAEGDDEIDLGAYGLAAPSTTVTLGAGSTRATLALGDAAPNGDIYGRDLARSIVFTTELSLLDDVTKDAADYRRKDIFDFRSWNASRLAITRDDITFVFEKRTEGDDEAAIWRRVEPEGEVENDKMQTLLSRLSGLRASAYAESRQGTGLETPSLTVDVQFEDGAKQERMEFARTGDGVYAAADQDASVATIETSAYDEVLAALDDVSSDQ